LPDEAAKLAPHVSDKAEVLTTFGPFNLTNSLLTMWITMALLLVLAWLATRRIRANPAVAMIPTGLQGLAELVLEGIENLVRPAMGKYTVRMLPVTATFLIFILIANWFSLLPGVGTIWVPVQEMHQGHLRTVAAPILRPATADINMTLAMALLAFLVIHGAGVAVHGPWGHIKEVSKLAPLAPVFILIELFVVVSLSFRLFGNLFAGEVLLNGPLLFGFALGHIPFIGVIFLTLEILFGLIQAVIFSMLSLVFTSLSVATPAHAEH